MTGTFRERRRRVGVAGLIIGLLATAIPLLSATPASADTATAHTVTASTSSQTNVLRPTALTGLVDAQTVTVRVTEAGPSNQISGIVAVRQCEGGVNIVNAAEMGPSNTGYCLDAPLSAGSHSVRGPAVKLQPADNFIDITFNVGIGSRTVAYDDGSPQTNLITCDSLNDCSLWIQIARAGGNDFVHYDLKFLGAPGAPTAAATCTATGANVTLTPPAFNGNSPIASYTVSATPTDGGAAVAPVTTATTSAAFTTFTPFKLYDITATATNAGGQTSVASAPVVGVKTCPAGPTNVQTVVAPGQVTVSWLYADSANASGYEVVLRNASQGNALTTVTVTPGSNLDEVITGLTTGDQYFAKVRATYAGSNFSAYSAESQFSPPPNTLITQTITVRRPAGALVLTQVCSPGGTSPTITGGGPDPLFPQYPYPEDPTTGDSIATYPTDCGINMGPAKLIKTGTGAGQFFKATGALNQVTVVDTRDSDPGWTVNGRMANFTQAIPGAIMAGDQLGWVPVKTSDTGLVTFSDGTTYDQTVTAGGTVAPNTLASSGLGLGASSGRVLGSAPVLVGLGISQLDAALELWIPINARTGNYTGILTITAV